MDAAAHSWWRSLPRVREANRLTDARYETSSAYSLLPPRQGFFAKCLDPQRNNSRRGSLGKPAIAESILHAAQNDFAARHNAHKHRHKRFAQLILGPHASGGTRGRRDDEHGLSSKA